VSKLENGRQTPTDDDIRGFAAATNAEGEMEALLASLHTLEVQHAEWQRILRTGLKPWQQEHIGWDQKTRSFRAFEATVIPGLLQTAQYARAGTRRPEPGDSCTSSTSIGQHSADARSLRGADLSRSVSRRRSWR
jgi:Domain of unknown function (DUF5753)